MKALLLPLLLGLSFSAASFAADDKPGMNNRHMDTLIRGFNPNVEGKPGHWQFHYKDSQVLIITDERANRMRIIVPIAKSKDLSKTQLIRMMQANFDSALDARYSIAQGVVWAAFIHPLKPLDDGEFFSGLAQALTAAKTWGKSYSSGALVFGGGDSKKLHQDYYQAIIDRANAI